MRSRTGWKDLDDLLAEAERLDLELIEIQKAVGDILYPGEKKPVDDSVKDLVKSA